jgi:hypothetical protein
VTRRWPRKLRPLWLALGVFVGLLIASVASMPEAQADEPIITVGTRARVIGPLKVTIDIKPGSYPNSINLSCKGRIPVAVLTTPGFNASTVNPATVIFAGARPVRWGMKDVDHDRDLDLLLHFNCRDVSIPKKATQACLQARTYQGVSIEGCDSVRIVHVRWPLIASAVASTMSASARLPIAMSSSLPTALPPSGIASAMSVSTSLPMVTASLLSTSRPPSTSVTLPSSSGGAGSWGDTLPWATTALGGGLALLGVTLAWLQRPHR